jgi:alanine racemase
MEIITIMSVFTRPVLEINLENLADNYKLLQKIVAPAEAAAVVKDNAYGLGADIVAETLYRIGCRHFWVAHAIEGEKIAPLVPDAKIYVLQGVGEDSLDLFKKYGFVPVISSPEMLRYWQKNGRADIKPVIHIETGLNRLGFRAKDLAELSAEDRKMFGMVMSHLACADEKDHFMNKHQLDTFYELKNRYFPDIAGSLSASDGAFLGADFCCDMVRLGAAMYGINTAPYRLNQMKNILTVKAPVLQVTDLPKGEFVGYSATYRATTERKIAIISIGYGDGVPRSLSNIGRVLFVSGGKWSEARIIGRVSMDNVICDITNAGRIGVGDWGYVVCDEYTLDDIARDAGTISYEILSRLGKNPRFVKKIKKMA